MRITRTTLAALAALGLGCVPATTGAAEADLDWLSGCWEQNEAGKWTEECWTAPRGGMLMGSGRSGEGDKVASYEFMRIAPGDDGTPVFWGSPNGQAPVAFRMTRSGASEIVFENPAHDYPVSVRYRREGDTLDATTAGPGGKNPMSWRYKRK